MTDSPAEPLTEAANPASVGIDRLEARAIVEIIHGQDLEAWRAIDGALDVIATVIEAVVAACRDGGRLIYIGAGTSGRLGVLDASECPPTYGVPPDLVIGLIAGGDEALRDSVEGAEDSPAEGARTMTSHAVDGSDVVCGIAASGSTPYVLGALEEARRRGAITVLLTCNPFREKHDEANFIDHVITVPVGPEVIAGSTRMKAGTATKMVLNMITTASMIRLGKVYDNLMVDVRPVNHKLIRRARKLICSLGHVAEQEAAELLEHSGGNVKAAIVMARRQVDLDEARRLLEQSGGLLRAAMGE